jgi:phage shock protein PspC (stress-responsive transcriptional regulator)
MLELGYMQVRAKKEKRDVITFLAKHLDLEPELVGLLMATFLVGFPAIGIPAWWVLFLFLHFKK